jgi:2-polyprenyl-3-methyl-5-hydroxy-6-metoxy-1,4-benzoquinol methylase
VGPTGRVERDTIAAMAHGASSAPLSVGDDHPSTDPTPLTTHPYVVGRVLQLAAAFRPRRVLDIGCGKGALLGELSRRGCVTVGIDTSEERIAVARRIQPNTRFEVMAADDLILDRLREPPFDLVISTEVVEHLCEPWILARGCLAALRPGGRAILSTPYHGWLKNVLIATTGRFDRHVDPLERDGHVKFWSRRTLEGLLTTAGFVDLQFHGVGRLPLVWKSIVMTGDRPG